MIILYDKTRKILYNETNKENIIDDLYYDKVAVPRIEQVEEYIKKNPTDAITKYFKNNVEINIKKIKKAISQLDYKMPLYDVYNENIYVIDRYNIYDRVMNYHYRFPSKHIYELLKNKYANMKTEKMEHPLEIRQREKTRLMINFLSSFSLKTLYYTYMKMFYLYSEKVGKDISFCRRPSFTPYFRHLQPYYKTNDIYNIALNMGKTEKEIKEMTETELCFYVVDNDISAELLLEHQKHIIKNNKTGLIQYYTLQGSYYMNQYMRNHTSYECENIYLESLITPVWELINSAPAFDNNYTVYRFIHTDNHLRELNNGDIHIENSFISTTRDPFYRSDLYKFGFILIKINIPKNIKGVALCVETLSHFPEEQEIIFAPLSIFRLEKKDDKCVYYHADKQFCSQVKTRYEFTYMGQKEITYMDRPLCDKNNMMLDFLQITAIDTYTLEEKINYFMSKYVNKMNQFAIKLNDNHFTILTERYDSTGAYRKFYAEKNQNGLLFYTLHDNYILFMIEIGEIKKDNSIIKYMHVNYYIRYSTIIKNKLYTDKQFIQFISEIAHYFGIEQIILWADFMTCDKINTVNNTLPEIDFIQDIEENNKIIQQEKQKDKQKDKQQEKQKDKQQEKQKDKPQEKQQREYTDKGQYSKYNKKYITGNINYYGGIYCVDFYLYLKTKKKRYDDIDRTAMHPKFMYHQLDILRKTSPDKILVKTDQDELYQIYNKIYIMQHTQDKYNICDFYLWIIHNNCNLTEILINKIYNLYIIDNPFDVIYYTINPQIILYNSNNIGQN